MGEAVAKKYTCKSQEKLVWDFSKPIVTYCLRSTTLFTVKFKNHLTFELWKTKKIMLAPSQDNTRMRVNTDIRVNTDDYKNSKKSLKKVKKFKKNPTKHKQYKSKSNKNV